MSDPLTITPPRRYGPAATPEALFRGRAAGLHDTAAPQPINSEVIVLEGADGGVVVFPPSDKLVILAAERARRAKR